MSDNISKIINKNEGANLEFKQDFSSADKIVKTTIAFANCSGGQIIIGVEDETKKILGAEEPLKLEENIANKLSDCIAPKIIPIIEIASTEDNKQILIINVYPSPIAPHHLTSKGELHGTYIRVGSTNRIAEPERIEEIKRNVSKIHYDTLPFLSRQNSEIDNTKVTEHFPKLKGLDNNILKTMDLITEVEGKMVPTIAGYLLFGKNRKTLMPNYKVQMARFRDDERTIMEDSLESYSSPLNAIEEVENFIKKHSIISSEFGKGLKRKDTRNVPMIAVREALVNAFVHADYSAEGSSFRIGYYDNRIEIENPGSFMPGLTKEDMMAGRSILRNLYIPRIFHELGMFEHWARGFKQMNKDANILGVRHPDIEELPGRVKTTIFILQIGRSEERPGLKKRDLVSNEETKLSIKETKFANYRAKILEYAKQPRTKKELFEYIGLYPNTKNTRAHLKPLIEDGLIEMLDVRDPSNPSQKYISIRK
jgi:predicted HTH transcriptional regulator